MIWFALASMALKEGQRSEAKGAAAWADMLARKDRMDGNAEPATMEPQSAGAGALLLVAGLGAALLLS